MKPVVHVCTGPVQSGKSHRLRQWCRTQSGLGGFLALRDENHRKWLHPLGGGNNLLLEIPAGSLTDEESAATRWIPAGRFLLSAEALEAGCRILERDRTRPCQWLVVDEVGPLELAGGGWATPLDAAVASLRSETGAFSMVWVVREGILAAVAKKWDILPVELRA